MRVRIVDCPNPFVLCVAVSFFSTKFRDDIRKIFVVEGSQQAGEMARAMIDYTLPTGYRETGGMNVLAAKMVFIHSDEADNGGMSITLTSFIKRGYPQDVDVFIDSIR